jgi:hypothetical protein
VRSHQRVAGRGTALLAASTSLSSPRSTISAWPDPETAGKLATDATIWTVTVVTVSWPNGIVVDDPMPRWWADR